MGLKAEDGCPNGTEELWESKILTSSKVDRCLRWVLGFSSSKMYPRK
ncbi:hypothetical protein LEMLEM_LOCUS23764 [Lemmus lemmus]